MSEAISSGDRCGCEARRRLCDECESAGKSFVACSLACLERHRAAVHASASAESAVRARAHLVESNRQRALTRKLDSVHRSRLLTLFGELPHGAELCIFGASDAQELELERLAERFREIHLVDLDGDALARVRDAQEGPVRARIVLHEGVDASGLLEHLDTWGDRFPERAELARVATEVAQSIVHGLGRTFPAVASICLLNQLALPFQRTWLVSRNHWAALLSTISAIHLATLAGASRSGGRCLLVTDVASSRDMPALAEQRDRSLEELSEFVHDALDARDLHLRPDPGALLAQLSSPGMRTLVSEPRLSDGWLRQSGAETELLYGLTFDRP